MTRRRAIKAAGVILAVGCAPRDPAAAHRLATDAVYAAAIDSFAPGPARRLAVESVTRPYSLARSLGDTSDLYRAVRGDGGITNEQYDAFERANAAPDTLCDCFPRPPRVELQPGVSPPASRGPVLLSGVGFDSQRRRALVWVAQSCGPLCGSSALFLVERRGRSWVVARPVLTGAS